MLNPFLKLKSNLVIETFSKTNSHRYFIIIPYFNIMCNKNIPEKIECFYSIGSAIISKFEAFGFAELLSSYFTLLTKYF